MFLTVIHEPIAKKRPRFGRNKGKVITYDEQYKDKRSLKWHFASQMRENGFKMLSNEPIEFTVLCYTPIPKSLSKAKKTALRGTYNYRKPDLDNYVKFYADVLNGIAYEDDNLIACICCKKLYSDEPRVEIYIQPLGENMINEHAITVKGEVSVEDLNYLIKKANRLGRHNREVVRVYMQEDDEGRHIYFEAEAMKPQPQSVGEQ